MKLAIKHQPTRSYQGISLFTPVIKQHRSPQGCFDLPPQAPKPKGTQFLISLHTTEDGRPGSSTDEAHNVLGTSLGDQSPRTPTWPRGEREVKICKPHRATNKLRSSLAFNAANPHSISLLKKATHTTSHLYKLNHFDLATAHPTRSLKAAWNRHMATHDWTGTHTLSSMRLRRCTARVMYVRSSGPSGIFGAKPTRRSILVPAENWREKNPPKCMFSPLCSAALVLPTKGEVGEGEDGEGHVGEVGEGQVGEGEVGGGGGRGG